MQKVLVQNIDTGVKYEVSNELYEANKLQFIFIKRIEVNVPKEEVPVATVDIHQMNKGALIVYAKEVGAKINPRMTIAKLKEAIEEVV
jgi:hypothetical protein